MLLNRSGFRAALLMPFTKCAQLSQNLSGTDSSSLSKHCNSVHSNYPHTFAQEKIGFFNSFGEGEDSMPSRLYKKLITVLNSENFGFKAVFDKIQENRKDFNYIQDAILFFLDLSLLNNYDCSKLKDFLSKFIKFVDTFNDENTKIILSNYFINSDFFLSKLIDKDPSFLAFDSSYKTLLFLQKILKTPNLKKFFLETDKSETLSPEDSTNFIQDYFSFFIQNGVLSLKETSKQMAIAFVRIIQQSQDEALIKAIQNLLLKYFPMKNDSFNEAQKSFVKENITMLLLSINYVKGISAKSKILKKIQASVLPSYLELLYPSDQAYQLGFSGFLQEILLISNFIKEPSNSANAKQKSFDFLSNRKIFKPFLYTKFKEIMNALLKKIESEKSYNNFIKENNQNEASIAAFKIEKLISRFSTESLEFYKEHFIQFLNHEMKISNPQIHALTIRFFFNSAVICNSKKVALHCSHTFGKQISFIDSDTHKANLGIRSVEIAEINKEIFEREYHFGFSNKITLRFQDSDFFYKPANTSKASEIILEKDICHVFKTSASSKRLENFKIILPGLLYSLPDTDKNDLIINLMRLCPFYFEFHENSAVRLFRFLKKKHTRELPEDLVFFENIFLFILRNHYYNDRYFRFKNFYAFLREKDFPTVDLCLEFIFKNSKNSQEIIFLSKLFIPAYKLKPMKKNIAFISEIYDFFKRKDQNSALNFIHNVLSLPKDYCDYFYIEPENLSKFINQIFSSLICNEDLDVSTLGSIFELANKNYSSKLTKDTVSTFEKRLRDSNIDKKNKNNLLDRIKKLNNQK